MTSSTGPKLGPHWLAVIVPLAIGVAGYYGPWVPHRAAGLVVMGLDLAEYVKFLPRVASGQIALGRDLFYLPLFTASITCALLASRRSLPRWSRWLLAVASVPLAFAMLPPAWSPSALMAEEYRTQVLAITVCIAMVAALAVTRYLPNRVTLWIIAVLALASVVGPASGFIQIRPAIEELYRHPLPLGWGFYACVGGFLATSLFSVSEALRPWRIRRR